MVCHLTLCENENFAKIRLNSKIKIKKAVKMKLKTLNIILLIILTNFCAKIFGQIKKCCPKNHFLNAETLNCVSKLDFNLKVNSNMTLIPEFLVSVSSQSKGFIRSYLQEADMKREMGNYKFFKWANSGLFFIKFRPFFITISIIQIEKG